VSVGAVAGRQGVGWQGVGDAQSGHAVLGGLVDDSEPFTLGLRTADDVPHGDITRKLDVRIDPGMTWKGDEPEAIIFTSAGGKAKTVYREAERIRKLLSKSPNEIASGQIKCEELKQDK
jgi:hypothetical protein